MIRSTAHSAYILRKCLNQLIAVRETLPSRSVSTLRVDSASKPKVPILPKNPKRGKPSLFLHPSGKHPKSHAKPIRGELKKPLRPHVFSKRLLALCKADKIEEAVSTLQNAPLDAQNTIVWNTLIREVLLRKRFKLGYQLYVDMKRRGFSPRTSTFVTMLNQYATIEQWSQHTKQLDNVHTLFENYIDHVEQVKEHEPNSPELDNSVYVPYFKILGDAGEYQKMFDIYYAMPDHGPLAPTHFTFTALINAISCRKPASNGAEALAEVRAQNASDVRLLWRQAIKHSERNPQFQIDSHFMAPVLGVLALGRPADQLFAFDIIRDFTGLAKPGEDAKPARVPLTPYVLTEVLWLCTCSKKYRLAIYYFWQAVESMSPEDIARPHFDNMLRAHVGLTMMGASQQSHRAVETLERMLREAATRPNCENWRPSLSTFTLALATCWREGDWVSATTIFELMTGYKAEDFADGGDNGPRVESPQMEKRSKGRNIMPGMTAMSHLVRTALASCDQSNMRQCLRIVDHLDVTQLMTSDKPKSNLQGKEAILAYDVKDSLYFVTKLAKDLITLVDEVVQRDVQPNLSAEEARWREMRNTAKKLLRRHSGSTRTPFYESQLLGTERSLAATDSAVEQEQTVRRTQRSATFVKRDLRMGPGSF
ncbi:uncharacterized protein FIBRA_06988 [Fibroporia radiculosa]|uniref:Pentacotripeptide-repeat region of PRORP domain-containing protein n=1 Tax=Fibroporia radiculosa TaxID=599839 RepID=J4GU26_9APHY|nr:uncharacterized protein FIBRA_06988 [Fibroporia radiculosa]CCM04795.1 predicted protein [Fibroporia radiculosa]